MNDIEIILGVQGLPKYQADMGKAAQATSNATNSITNGLKNAASAFGLLTGAAAAAGLVKSAVSSAIAYETLSIQFEVFLGSAEKATKVLGDLNKFSIETPFTPDQVNAAGRSLLAFGITAEKLIPTMKMVGDVSAAVGKDFNELATIYGKARTAGTLFAEDINQLTEAGIPIIEELARVMGVSADQVKKLGSEGKIHFSTLEKAFANMTSEGGRFAGMMDKMSLTTEGLLSTLEGKFQDAMRAVGTSLVSFVKNNSDLLLSIGKATLIVGAAALAWKAYNAIVAFTPVLMAAVNAATITVQAAYIALTGSTTLAAGAMKAFQIIMASNPWGLAVTAIAALAAGLYLLTKNSNEATEAQKRFQAATKLINDAVAAANAEIGKEIFALDQSIKKLGEENTTKGQKLKITNDIIGKYGQYLSDLDKEKIKAGEVAAAYTKIKDAIIASVNARQKAEAIDKLLTEQLAIQRDAAFRIGKSFGKTTDDMLSLTNAFKSLSPQVQQMALDGESFRASMSGQFTDDQKESLRVFEKMAKTIRETNLEAEKRGISDFRNPFQSALDILVSSTTLIDTGLAEIDKRFGASGSGIDILTEKIEVSGKKVKELATQFGFLGAAEGFLLQRAMDQVSAEKDRAKALADTAKEAADLLFVLQEGANTPQPQFLSPTDMDISRAKAEAYAASLKATFKDLGDSIKTTFVEAGATIAEGIGNAIATGGSALDVFKAVLKDLLVQVPKLAGMALLNFAATVPGPQSLPLAIAGLGLIGLSGLLGGLFKGKEGKANSIASDIPAPAVQRTQNNSLAAFGASVNNSIGQQVADALDGRRMQLVLSDGKQLDAYVKDANKRNNEREGK